MHDSSPTVLKNARDDGANVPFTASNSCAYTCKLFNKYLPKKRKVTLDTQMSSNWSLNSYTKHSLPGL